MISEVFYVSHSTHRRGHRSDVDIMQTALKNNTKLNLTGCLIRGEDWFAQSLEGPHDPLEQVFGKVRLDQRHHSLRFWWTENRAKRRFPEWRLLVANADDYRDFNEDLFRSEDASADAKHKLMLSILENHIEAFNFNYDLMRA